MNPSVFCAFDDTTRTASYVVSDPATARAAIIDAVLDFDPVSGRTGNAAVDRLLAHVDDGGLTVEWVLDTHIHADHLSAAALLGERCDARIGMGRGLMEVRRTLAPMFGTAGESADDSLACDTLFEDGDTFAVGTLECRVLATPGHTPSCVTYVVGDACFVGDVLFMPDSGTARCDFPGGSAAQLYASIQRIFELPDATRMFVGHDYGANGRRDIAWETSVGEQRDRNIHVGGGTLEHDFIEMRRARDETLGLPRLFFPALQVNMRAGRLPPPDPGGVAHIRIPLNSV